MKNKYVKRSKISEAKFRKIILYFSLELDSQKIAAATSLNRNTVNRYLGRIRARIADLCEVQARRRHADGMPPPEDSQAPADTPLTTATNGCLPVFGIRSRNDHIYTRLFSNGVRRQLRRFVLSGADQEAFSVPKAWHYYDGIVDLNGRWHYRLSPVTPGAQTREATHGSVEAFLGFARKRLNTIHLNGGDHFNWYLKECEFRFNNRSENLYHLLLRRFREKPLS